MSQSLVLASTSPRRKELLQQIGVVFTQLSIDINEDVAVGENAEQYVLRLAKEKAIAGFERLSAAEKINSVVLAADTTVVCDGQILAKPESLSHSKEILAQLSGREHVVMSAIGLHSQDKTLQKVVTTKVRFRSISDAEIEAYWHSGEPQDKAGSYGIQGLGAVFVESITGSYSNVVGLPLCETAQLLNQFNIAFLAIMKAEILINVTPTETRVTVVENGVLQEVFIEREHLRGLVGNVYKGKVVRVLPGMQAAFVDIGLERAGFIHASDIIGGDAQTPIMSLLHEGQKLVVQVTKDPISTKGARLTNQLAIPSRYLVYMPDTDHVGVSQRIDGTEERDRLRALVATSIKNEALTGKGGFILRTAAEGAGEEEINADTRYLKRLWVTLGERLKGAKVPSLVYDELPLFLRTMRDYARPEITRVLVDSKETYQRIEKFVEQFVPEILPQLEYYPGPRPILDLYGVEDEMQRALERKVPLKSGGYLVIDQTEAMTTIDVNTGAFVGRRNLEETIFKTNLEAATAIGRQLRLRNLGGIIILDFIDMQDVEHQRQVLRMLEKVLEKDHAKTKISGVSDLGLVEMTRKRTRESLGQMLTEACACCDGRGTVKTAETICYDIFREILREERAYDASRYLVLASPPVIDRLLDEDSSSLADLEAFMGKTIKLQVEPNYAQDQYDIVLP